MITYPSSHLVKNENETVTLAETFMSGINAGDRVVLNGELGAGKTFFIKAALNSLNIVGVNSPSFSIVNEYTGKSRVYHFDFFRLKNRAELLAIGWQDYLNDNDSIMFIEWGNLIPEALPSKRVEITITDKNGTEREIVFDRFY